MADKVAFVKEVSTYLERAVVTDRHTGRQFKPSQKLLWVTDPATISRKLRDPATLTDKDVRAICATLISWQCITHRKRLLYLFDLGDYRLSDHEWSEEPWKSLIDDTIPLQQPEWLSVQNASFEDWKHNEPVKWLCNTKTGWVKPAPGKGGGKKALEIGGNWDNREWVYCRTRETQDIRVVPGSKICLSFWAKKTQEGKHPERSKYVEVFFHDGFEWGWGFGQDVTNTDDWVHYETEWWTVPANVQKVSVGAVAYKDGAFHVDDIELRMRTGK